MTKDMTKDNTPPSRNCSWVARRTPLAIAAGLLTLFLFPEPALALTPDDLIFYASFDKELQPERQPIASSKPTLVGKPDVVPGRTGQALRLRNGVDAVSYYLHTYAGRQGTIAFWLSAGDWDGASSDASQVLFHTGSNERSKQQLVVQTLTPNPGLGMIVYRQGDPLGGPTGARALSAPLRRAQDAMSVLRKGEWYHYTVTWRDGRFTFYFNGKPVTKQQFDPTSVTDIGSSFSLGWNKDKCPLWLEPGTEEKVKPLAEKPWESLVDDFAFFRRCLSAQQVEQVFKEGPITAAKNALPDDPAFGLKAEFLQTTSSLWATVNNLNTPDGKERRGALQVRDVQDKIVGRSEITLPAGQAEVETILDLPGLPVGRYTIRLELQNEGAPFVMTSAFERVKPVWLGNKLGTDDVVLAPWTPVKVIPGNPLRVEVWGRTYSFDGPLPSAISSQGEELLARPVAWHANAGQGEAAVTWSTPTVESSSPTAVVLLSQTKIGSYAVQARTRLEYDGFLWSAFRFTAPQPATLQAMRVEIPMPKTLTRFFQYTCRRDNLFPKADKPWANEFGSDSYYLMVCNDRVGLQWYAESDQWWYAKERKKQLEVAATAEGGVMRVNFVRDAIEMPADFTLAFGLMATPVRPRPANWRGWGNGTPWRSAHRDQYFPISLDYSNWSVGPGWVEPGLKQARPWQPGQPKLWMPFTSGNFYALRHFRDKESPDNWFPEWRQFHPEWWREPDIHSNVKGEAWNEGMVNPSPSFTDHFVWQVNEFFRDSNPDGLYFDGFPGQVRSANRRVGFGYVDRDGKARGTMPLRAGREMMRRVYAVVQKYRGDQGALLMHTALSFPMPILSFSHAVLDGEFMFWTDIKEPMEKDGPLTALTEDRMRTVLCLRQLGLVMDVDGRMLGNTTKNAHTARRVMAEFLHHDTPCWGDINGYNAIFNPVIDWWGLADPAVEYIGYWDARPAGTVYMGRVSAYVNRSKGKVLLICTNDGGYGRNPGRFAAEKQWGYHVKLDLARLGLKQGQFIATDAESLGGLPVLLEEGNRLSLHAEPNAVMLVALQAK